MKEQDIRPKEVLDRYLELSKIDGEKLNMSEFEQVNCVACNSENYIKKFSKNNYAFSQCFKCNTLFCNPRPNNEQLAKLYFNSESSNFWSNVFFPQVKEARREKLFKPKAEKINNIISSKLNSSAKVCDVGAGHGLLLEELKKFNSDIDLYAVEPDSTSAKECRSKGIQVLEEISDNANEWHSKFDLTLSFEVIEHVQSPKQFIKSLYNLTNTNGYTLITGLGYEGFDILTLGEKSKSISPPHHLNFLSLNGYEKVFKEVGFSEVEVWTPGQLDVDITINSLDDNDFINALKSRGEEAISDLQKLLVKHKLSSHVWVLAKK